MIYDPIGHRVLHESQVEVIEPVAGLVPFRPRDSEYWLAYSPWTGRTMPVGELSDDVVAAFDRTIGQHCIVERVLERCATVRALKQAPPMVQVEAEFAVHEAMITCGEDHGAVQVGWRTAQARGFSLSEIAFALLTLNDEVALHETLDGVEVISVSGLVAQMRTTETGR